MTCGQACREPGLSVPSPPRPSCDIGRNPSRLAYDGAGGMCCARSQRWQRPSSRGHGWYARSTRGEREVQASRPQTRGRLPPAIGERTRPRRATPWVHRPYPDDLCRTRPDPACGPPSADPISSRMFPGSRSIQRLNGPDCSWPSPLFQVIVISSVRPSSPAGQVLLETLVDRGEQEIMAHADLDTS